MMKSSHAKRWITGIIAVPILFSIIYFSPEAVFAGFVLVVTVVAVLEYNRLAFGAEGIMLQRALLFFGVLAPLAAALSGQGAILAVAVLSSFCTFSARRRGHSISTRLAATSWAICTCR
jgi:CDP-diglyceride synthetase